MPNANIDLSRLPTTADLFVGRQSELQLLDDAWANANTHAVTVVALGGTGKTALVKRWLGSLSGRQYDGARVFGWSFYSQGSDEKRLASADEFFRVAWRFFTETEPPSQTSPRDLGRRLGEAVRERKSLLVLDGVEPLQDAARDGRLKDVGLVALLKALTEVNDGLCVVTTREPVVEIGDLGTTETLNLERLTEDDGAELLSKLKVVGTTKELVRTTQEFDGHALALRLLGNYLVRVHKGEVRCRDKVPLLKADAKQGGHAFRVMRAYEEHFGEGTELAVLRLLGLFDRPASEAALNALRDDPAIPGLTDSLVDLDEDDWNWSLGSLRSLGLVLPVDENAPGELDAHPLVREYFAGVLQERFPNAWRDGNLRLYEYLCRSAPDQPDTVEEMQPLFAAVVHGCRAGRQQEAFDEVFRRRIQRGGEKFNWSKLGAFGASLTALAGFFDRPWDRPSQQLDEGDRAFVLNEAGFYLRALGRLGEAVQPMRAALDSDKQREFWKGAAVKAGNVSELSLTLGDVEEAVAFGEEGVRLADRSGDDFQRMGKKVRLATALHQAGRLDESSTVFQEAETLQAKDQPQYPRLYGLVGFLYCDLLLGRLPWSTNYWERRRPACSNGHTLHANGSVDFEEAHNNVDDSTAEDVPHESRRDACAPSIRAEVERVRKRCEDVLERATQTLEWAEQHEIILDIALDNLTLGRAHFGLALAVPDDEHLRLAAEHLDEAVRGLRQAGTEHELPRGLIARAALRRVTNAIDDARADLDEALEIAERGGMRLFLCDARLEQTRLHVVLGQRDDARRSLDHARRLVHETGYHRRDEDLAELEALLDGMSQSEPSTSKSTNESAPSSSDVPAPSSKSGDVAAPSSSKNDKALALWREKLEDYEVREADAADPEMKFRLKTLIRETREMIEELEARE